MQLIFIKCLKNIKIKINKDPPALLHFFFALFRPHNANFVVPGPIIVALRYFRVNFFF